MNNFADWTTSLNEQHPDLTSFTVIHSTPLDLFHHCAGPHYKEELLTDLLLSMTSRTVFRFLGHLSHSGNLLQLVFVRRLKLMTPETGAKARR